MNMLMSGKKILIVDDERDIRLFIRGLMEDEGYKVVEAENVTEALKAIDDESPDAAILDIWLGEGDQDGLEILQYIRNQSVSTQVIMISGHASVDLAVKTIKKGAYDFIEKPFKSDRLLLMVRRALEAAELRKENENLKESQVVSHNASQESDKILSNDNFLQKSLKEARGDFEKQYLEAQIKRFNGNISETASFVGMERSALHRKIKSLNIVLADKE